MIEVVKDGYKMALRDANQLSAFLNNGWTKVGATNVEEKKSVVAEPKVEPKVEEKTYSKSDIQKMSASDVKALAESVGLDASLSSTRLKSALVEHFGL